MRLVLDASVALKTVLKEPESPAAISLRDEVGNQVHQLLAPDTLPVEVAHSLTRAARKGLIPNEAVLLSLTVQQLSIDEALAGISKGPAYKYGPSFSEQVRNWCY